MKSKLQFTACIVIFLVGHSESYNWVDAPKGVVPLGTYEFELYHEVHHFCEARDDEGQLHTGTFTNKEKICVYVNVKEKRVESSDKFQVLTLDPNEKAVWKHTETEIPANAVPCDDKESEECYLGMAFYSDGLCQQAPGKVFLKMHRIFMHIGPKLAICPFFNYLTIEDMSK